MKVALLADTHFGMRSDSLAFDNHAREFFTHTFFPYLDTHGIKTVVHLGDVFDRRKFVNFQTLRNCKDYFFEPMRDRGIEMLVVPGNHDTYYKNTNKVNSIDLLLREYENVKVFHEACEWVPDGRPQDSILLVPWICDENEAEVGNALHASTSRTCIGHFEISGFEMHRGVENEDGFDPLLFGKFDQVFSGHFHHRSTKGNIHYLGTPYQMTWSDHGDERGFHVFETMDDTLSFVANPREMFSKVFYDDSEPITITASDYKGTLVKLVVVNKTDFYSFDRTVDALYKAGVLELKIIEELGELDTDTVDDEKLDVEDTMTLLTECVDTLETNADRPRLKSVLKALYVEAQHRVM